MLILYLALKLNRFLICSRIGGLGEETYLRFALTCPPTPFHVGRGARSTRMNGNLLQALELQPQIQ